MSTLSQMLADYLQLRHSLGHELADAVRLLPDFVAHLEAQGVTTVTVQAALDWAQQPATAQVSNVGPRRMSAVRGFARYCRGSTQPRRYRRWVDAAPAALASTLHLLPNRC